MISGLRQAIIVFAFWFTPFLVRLLAERLGNGVWVLHVAAAALLAYRWGVRGAVAASLISGALISAAGLVGRDTSDFLIAAFVTSASLFAGLLFERKRSKEMELSNTVKDLEQLVITDPLTGVYNRRYLFERLQAEVARGKRYNVPVSVVMLDLDSFKAYNDKYGHLAGDVLLQNVAKTIRKALRQEDVVVRYGGDEFAIILAGADARSATITAERLRNAVKNIGMNMSLGVVTYPQDGVTAEELLRRADYYLLAAKAAGKDRVYALQG